jgi:glycosyltransferase involved in cell wall biosynthesis
MLRVAALTLGAEVPSARFRVRQFIPALAARGIEVREHHPSGRGGALSPSPWRRRAQIAARLGARIVSRLPDVAASRGADVTWLSKQAVVGIPSVEPLLGRPLVLDVDDAVWLARPLGERAAITAARCASAVIAGNDFLAAWYRRHNDAVHVVPTSIDTERFVPPSHAPARFVVGWTGSASTLPFLEAAEEGVARFLARRRDARLLVVCDVPPKLPRVAPEQLRWERWSPAIEVSAVQRMSVGLMPLPESELTRGKCSFKMLQSMACGRPVVVSPVGSNVGILAMDEVGLSARSAGEWDAALEALYADEARAARMGNAGRALVEREFSVRASAEKIERVFRAVVGQR